MKLKRVAASIGAVVLGVSLLGAIVPSAASAAPYPTCTRTSEGRTGAATCAPNGGSYLFRVSANCQSWSLIGGTRDQIRFGPWAQPGGISTVTCENNEKLTWVGVMTTGG